MAKFGMNDADNYGTGTNSYFSLKDNGETAKIRFLYRDMSDIEGVAVHEVEVNGKKMDVECLRTYNEPIDNCPLCAAQYKVNAKLYIPVYDIDADQTKIWTRGKTFFNKLASLCTRYNPLVATSFEVERIGKKGDTSTTYETYPLQTDNAIIEDFPEIKAEGLVYQSKSYEDLVHYLNTGVFPEDVPQGRNNVQQRTSQPMRNAPTREMPASNIRRRPAYSQPDNEF